MELTGLGRTELAAGRYQRAREAFERSLELEETPEALEGLGHAARWLVDPEVARSARERAYALYRDRGDRAKAAGVALWLGEDAKIVHGDEALAAGWYARSHTLLEGLDDVPERGWLAVREGDHALFDHADAVVALARAETAIELGRKHGDADLEQNGHALRGLASVTLGEVSEGMRELDAASTAAIAGELTATEAGRVWCYLIYACQRVRDVQRAGEWCATVRRRARSFSTARCSATAARITPGCSTTRGEWEQAERELAAAADDFAAAAPGAASEAELALAELRRRQGRIDEAAAICDRYPAHHASLLCAAELAWDAGDAARARELLDRRNRKQPERVASSDLAGLDLAVRVHAAAGERGPAQEAARRLTDLASTEASRAAAAYASGLSAADDARGPPVDGGRDRQLDLVGMPFETARARVALARNLRAAGREADANRELEAARAMLAEVGSTIDAAAMDSPLSAAAGGADGELTARELEILRNVAEGLSDNEIAKKLYLSPHTVHRHVANIRTKLRQPSRAAAAAQAARDGLI